VDAAPVEAVVVAVPPGHPQVAEEASRSSKLLGVVEGGSTRQASIRAALAAVPEGFDAVVCHDAARPFASPRLFAVVLEALERADGAVPVVPVEDTVKRVAGDVVVETVPREELALAQTPQAFRRHVLEAAHRAALEDGVEATDDSALVERAGFKVVAVPGDPGNFKVTTPADLSLAAQRAAEPAGG
jgi:2-C-methyl-D-erythritol 4-phosphate cytidylyltransferase/2-C-methyl-D-erythritol 2,4-cyclodiphosphate synthase